MSFFVDVGAKSIKQTMEKTKSRWMRMRWLESKIKERMTIKSQSYRKNIPSDHTWTLWEGSNSYRLLRHLQPSLKTAWSSSGTSTIWRRKWLILTATQSHISLSEGTLDLFWQLKEWMEKESRMKMLIFSSQRVLKEPFMFGISLKSKMSKYMEILRMERTTAVRSGAMRIQMRYGVSSTIHSKTCCSR